MTIITAIVLGILQGLTEFLPLSSSGHLILFEKILTTGGDFMLFNIALHVGTLIAAVFYFRKTIFALIKKPFCPLALKLYLSTIITITFVLIFERFITESFSNNFYIIGFAITALLLIVTTLITKRKEGSKKIGFVGAAVIGVSQSLACLPGISRSGTTLCCSLLMGNEKEESVNFCFLLSIPIILASLVYEIVRGKGGGDVNIYLILIGGVFAFLSGFAAVSLMVKVVKKRSLLPFALYLALLILLTLIFML